MEAMAETGHVFRPGRKKCVQGPFNRALKLICIIHTGMDTVVKFYSLFAGSSVHIA